MNEMLPEERQIVETLNPWLKLSLCDRDWHRSLYIKSFFLGGGGNNREWAKREEKNRGGEEEEESMT